MTAIETLLDKNCDTRLRVAVLGDTILDSHVQGTVERISPECPVPVFKSEGRHNDTLIPGGAANAARQLQPWNVEVKFLSMVSPFTCGLLGQHGIHRDRCIIFQNGGDNPVKRRFVCDGHTMLRWDIEKFGFGDSNIDELRKEILKEVKSVISDGLDVLIMSDYLKGLLNHEIIGETLRLCHDNGIKTVVDPKRLWMWSGATVCKMNARESRDTIDTGAEHLVVTCGEVPPVLYSPPETPKRIKQVGPPVHAVSVAGAGDHFAAILGLCLGHGLSVEQSAQIAHESGCVYVTRPHNDPVLPYEVHARFDPAGAKIMTAEEVRKVLDVRKTERIVFSNGVFSLCHAGHLATLQWARQQGDYLVVGVNSDESARRCKQGREPILPDWQRCLVLAGLQCVDFVVMFSEDTPEKMIDIIKPNVIVKGPEHYLRKDKIPGVSMVQEVLTAPVTRATQHVRDFVYKCGE